MTISKALSAGLIDGTGAITPANVTVSTNNLTVGSSLYVVANGNVGIGNATPTGIALHVQANTNVANVLRITGSNTDLYDLTLGINDSANGSFIYENKVKALRFGTSGAERMRISSGGDVGIGTLSPATYGNYTTLTLNNPTQGGLLALNSNDTNKGQVYCNTTAVAVYTIPAVPLVFGSNNAQRMIISANGNVGIGNATPVTYFHLQTGASVGSPRASTFSKVFITANGTSVGDNYVELQSPNTSSFDILFSSNSSSPYGIVRYDNNINAMNFWTNSTEQMRINSSGQVGINTTSPSAGFKLDVKGAAYFHNDGSHTNVLCATDGASNHPVFQLNNVVGDWDIGLIGANQFSIRDRAAGYAQRVIVDSAGKVSITAGQLQFPASQNASTDANCLDDYEEGTWTPAWGSSGSLSAVQYATQIGRYIKIGRVVHFWGRIYMNGWATGGSGNIRVTGLPFTSFDDGAGLSLCNVTFTYSGGNATWPTGATQVFGEIQQGTTFFEYLSLGVPTNSLGENGKLQWSSNPAMFNNYFCGTYITSS